MTVQHQAAQSVCMGCCLNPAWFNSYDPYYHWPHPAPMPNPFQQTTFINTNDFVKLTPEEKEILQKLGEAFTVYSQLEKRSEADNKEFTDAIHRLQQLIALRVARRVDLDVWAQPE
jgi:hypothetical protein